MPLNALDNPLVLPMLGLLAESPRHQYALLSQLRQRYPFLHAKTSTVYTLVRSLQQQTFVALEEGADASGPQLVRLTEAGWAQLRRTVERQLREADPNLDLRFTIALAYIGVLDPREASLLLRERVTGLRHNLQTLTTTLHDAELPELPELHMIECHFLASRLQHDIAWLDRLAERIDGQAIAWPAPAGETFGAGG